MIQNSLKFKLSIGVIVVFCVSTVFSQQKLLLVGGGERPTAAMKKFVEWSGGKNSKILLITWATDYATENIDELKKDLEPFGPITIEHAPRAPFDSDKKTTLIKMLNEADGVFFSGGDQNKIMAVLADQELLELIKKKYAAGIPFGGTSAGAAVMSDPMLTGVADLKILDGEKVGLAKGIGLLPGVIVDQHFLYRQRHNRLLGLMQKFPKFIGIGIDEDTAILVENNRKIMVAGKSKALFMLPGSDKGIKLFILKNGDGFDLRSRKAK